MAPLRSPILLRAALAALSVAALAGAQSARAQQPEREQRVVVVQNLAPLPRREVVAVAVPFPAGAVRELPALAVEGRATTWQPFGARWPDGSVRQALCLFPAEVAALGELRLPLVPAPAEPPAFPEPAPPAAGAVVEFVATTAPGTGEPAVARARPERVEVLEQNAMRTVELRRARIGDTGLVAELIVAQGHGDAHAYVDVAVFCSDPTTPAMQIDLRELAIESTGMALILRHAGRLGVQQETTENGSRVVLLRDTALGDGQGIRRCGALVPPLVGDGGLADASARAASACPLLGATDWSGSGAFGAFGEPAPLPPWLGGGKLRQVLAQRHATFVAGDKPGGDPFAAGPFGLAKSAGQTGDQMDFGTVKLSVVAASGMPSFLLEVEASVLQEACRPVHFFAADGSILRAADHPDWIVWSGRTHWHPEVSKDRLGKPVPEPRFERHGWTGKDRQHWSSNYIGAFAQLTGAHWARRELQHEAQLYLSGQTVREGLSTSGAGAPRGAGRTLLAACWVYLATGDEAVLERMRARLDQVYFQQWAGRELPPEKVRPMAVANPDARMLQGKVRYWTPWQDALAAVGFAAAFRISGNGHARILAEELAINVVRHGFRIDDEVCIVATAMKWQDGEPLSAQQLADPDCVLWSFGTAFTEWSAGAVEIARTTALARGDTAIAERAAAIQQRMRQQRTAPRDGFMDRLGEWDAVHWQPDR